LISVWTPPPTPRRQGELTALPKPLVAVCKGSAFKERGKGKGVGREVKGRRKGRRGMAGGRGSRKVPSLYTGRAKNVTSIKILYVWNCSRYIHQIYGIYF